MIGEREKNTAFYTHEETTIDATTGEILNYTQKTIAKTSTEPDFIKVYYETMMAFNQIHDIPTSFVLSLSKFLEWTNNGKPQCVTINKRVKGIMCEDCKVSLPQIDRYVKKSVDNGLLFRTEFRGVFEVNPFMIAKGKWDSIKQLRANFDFVGGKWERVVEYGDKEELELENEQLKRQTIKGQLEIVDTDLHLKEA